MRQPKTSIFVVLEPDVKALIDEVADAFGLSTADYVRLIIKKELRRKGYLKEMPAPMKKASPNTSVNNVRTERSDV